MPSGGGGGGSATGGIEMSDAVEIGRDGNAYVDFRNL